MKNDLLLEDIHLRDNLVIPLINEILRRHDHDLDAQILDAKLFTDLIKAHTDAAVRAARIEGQYDAEKFLTESMKALHFDTVDISEIHTIFDGMHIADSNVAGI